VERDRHSVRGLGVIDDLTPPDKELHLIADNYATHKHPKVQKWKGALARIVTSVNCSWRATYGST